MKIDLVVFDLDGTLVSSHETIYKATHHALRAINISTVMPEDKFLNMIGLHFEDIFREFGFAVPDFEHFIKIYKSIYFDYMNSSFVYSGVEEMLQKLNDKKIKVSLLTTKGQDQAELILKHFSLFNKFNCVMGRRQGIQHKPSPEPLLKICNELNVNVQDTLMVGDSELDVECGLRAGAKTCAVTYGYRTKTELQKANPNFLIDNILELEYLVNGS